ncbi:hypothetical protein [Aphanizomenon flos-aquae]|nr:hypothetical protein [Aphanizomenon flos-aquae]
MLLDDFWWEFEFFCLNQDVQDLRILGMLLDDFWWEFEFFCLNEDVQDLRIFRMLLDDFWWGFGDFLSESGCPGFEDFRDVVG